MQKPGKYEKYLVFLSKLPLGNRFKVPKVGKRSKSTVFPPLQKPIIGVLAEQVQSMTNSLLAAWTGKRVPKQGGKAPTGCGFPCRTPNLSVPL